MVFGLVSGPWSGSGLAVMKERAAEISTLRVKLLLTSTVGPRRFPSKNDLLHELRVGGQGLLSTVGS